MWMSGAENQKAKTESVPLSSKHFFQSLFALVLLWTCILASIIWSAKCWLLLMPHSVTLSPDLVVWFDQCSALNNIGCLNSKSEIHPKVSAFDTSNFLDTHLLWGRFIERATQCFFDRASQAENNIYNRDEYWNVVSWTAFLEHFVLFIKCIIVANYSWNWIVVFVNFSRTLPKPSENKFNINFDECILRIICAVQNIWRLFKHNLMFSHPKLCLCAKHDIFHQSSSLLFPYKRRKQESLHKSSRHTEKLPFLNPRWDSLSCSKSESYELTKGALVMKSGWVPGLITRHFHNVVCKKVLLCHWAKFSLYHHFHGHCPSYSFNGRMQKRQRHPNDIPSFNDATTLQVPCAYAVAPDA